MLRNKNIAINKKLNTEAIMTPEEMREKAMELFKNRFH